MASPIKVEFDVPATMRDGTVLRANVFRPDDGGIYPIALARTPYGKDFATSSTSMDAVRMARAGYIVVIQDTRGRFASEGEWQPFFYEGQDGYDTVEWAASLPGSNGNVGMWGGSYVGFTQWVTAVQNPPHLKAIMPFITWADTRDGVSWRAGALELGTIGGWLLGVGIDTLLKRVAHLPPQEQQQAVLALVHEIDQLRISGYFSLPLNEFAPLKRHNIETRLFFNNFPNNYSREQAAPYSVYESYGKINVPAYNIGGWYDIFIQGTLQNFTALRNGAGQGNAHRNRVLIGPWAHVNVTNTVGDVDFGFVANAGFINLQTDITGLTQRWFDYWLKGIDNGVMDEPPVKIFVMGENIWRDENEWPLARTQYTPFYLRSDFGLSAEKPGDEPADHYVYDPALPTPVLGGATLIHPLFGVGPKDQRPVEAREDVLSYTSAPLAQDMEVTGPVIVKLWGCSDARDTDFVARLIDVHPDGFARNLTDGIIRARYRNGDTPELLEPGKAYEFTIDLWATANVFKAGHRIRLDVTSASFPRWDRNPNTGDDFGVSAEMRQARQTILHDAAHPSHVILPVIPR